MYSALELYGWFDKGKLRRRPPNGDAYKEHQLQMRALNRRGRNDLRFQLKKEFEECVKPL